MLIESLPATAKALEQFISSAVGPLDLTFVSSVSLAFVLMRIRNVQVPPHRHPHLLAVGCVIVCAIIGTAISRALHEANPSFAQKSVRNAMLFAVLSYFLFARFSVVLHTPGLPHGERSIGHQLRRGVIRAMSDLSGPGPAARSK